MDELKERVVATEDIYQGKIINVRKDKVMLPDGRHSYREIVEHSGAVAVIPLAADGRVILIRQYRAPVGRVLLEVPAGKLEPGEAALACARRELLEETGYQAERLSRLTGFYTSPGFANEYIHLFLAEGLEYVGARRDSDEFIQVETYSLDGIKDLLAREELEDAKTMLALSLLLYRRCQDE
ncbi:MAG: NUDIX hydrolase [Halanaerobium sp.]|nr:NUDIX hydrolase [Halanaerobium sp.]